MGGGREPTAPGSPARALLWPWGGAPDRIGQRPGGGGAAVRGGAALSHSELAAAITTSPTRCPTCCTSWSAGRASARSRPTWSRARWSRTRSASAFYYHERGYRHAVVAGRTRSGRGAACGSRSGSTRAARAGGELDVMGAPMDLRMTAAARCGWGRRSTWWPTRRVGTRSWPASATPATPGPRCCSGTRSAATPLPRTSGTTWCPALVRFGEVGWSGPGDTPELIRRMLTFREGGRYDRSALLESQRNLYGLQIFRHAEIRAELEREEDGVVPITVQVAEGNMRRVRAGRRHQQRSAATWRAGGSTGTSWATAAGWRCGARWATC
jgi:hypothetical protein